MIKGCLDPLLPLPSFSVLVTLFSLACFLKAEKLDSRAAV